MESAPEALAILDLDIERFIDVNERALRLLGLDRHGFLSVDPFSLSPERLPNGRLTREAFDRQVGQALRGQVAVAEWVVFDRNGVSIPCELRLALLPSSTDRRLIRVSLEDLRDRRATEALKVELEGHLRQSNKLEAVGQLTGGVAHELNNLLTAVRANLELLAEGVSLGEDERQMLDDALQAAEQSARLAQRLLAFSGRQALSPHQVDPSRLLTSMKDVLRSELGDDTSIQVEVAPGTWTIVADPVQLESAVLNLALNARDAMPSGGTIRLHVDNVSARDMDQALGASLDWGDYVRLAVTDHGRGMPPDTVDRAFDPFFTTKGVGEGSGLGLSMVHGFVTQSGGTVRIDSAPGRGTTVTLYLPRDTAQFSRDLAEGSGMRPPRGSGERILVVADSGVSRLLSELLERLGYVPISASDGATALGLIHGGFGADALVTEVVLPGGMQGVDLASAARERIPDLPVLYMSGQPADVALEAGHTSPGAHVLRAPFDDATLARTLRRLLDG